MRYIYSCRRTFVGVLSIACLTGLGFFAGAEVAGSIATVVLAVAGSNAVEKVGKVRYNKDT